MKKKTSSTILLAITLAFVIFSSNISAHGTSEWTLKIDGAVSHPTILTISDLMAKPRSTVYAEIYCYGAFLTGGNWTGLSLRSLLENVAPAQGAMSLFIYAADGYTRDISITDAMREDVIIAYEFNGQPLSETLRLVLPYANGDRWVSMINQITISTDSPSYPQSNLYTDFNPQSFPGTLAPQPSPTPQPTLTPQPTPTPQPSPTPQPQQTPSPSPASPTPTPPTTNSNSEPYPTLWILAGVASVAITVTVLAIGSKKRKH